MTDERAVQRFPNIEMCGKGCTSGSWNEWPVLRAECRAILALLAEKDAERDRLAKQVERLRTLLRLARGPHGSMSHSGFARMQQDIDAALQEQPSV